MKDIYQGYIKYLFTPGLAVLNGYIFSIDAEDDRRYVANNVSINCRWPYYNSGYQLFNPLSVKRTPLRSEDGTILNEIEIGLDNVDLAFKNEVMLGKYNNKKCKVVQIFAERKNQNALGFMSLHTGYLDEPKGDEHWITFQIRPFAIFEREFPNRIFQIGCNFNFCDNNCTLDFANYYVTTTVSSNSDGLTIACAHGRAANYFVPGFVYITSGTYAGLYRPIVANDTSSVTCRIPFDFAIPAGTGIRVHKLCARNPAACINTFANYSNYGGFPHCPKSPIL
jgi:uncharacterized phage protein (TIGR02218 family)